MNIKTTLLIISAIVVLGLVGTSDMKMQELQAETDMANTCAYSYRVQDGALEEACGEMIDKIQSDGKHEVLSQGGKFWVEEK